MSAREERLMDTLNYYRDLCDKMHNDLNKARTEIAELYTSLDNSENMAKREREVSQSLRNQLAKEREAARNDFERTERIVGAAIKTLREI
jgi:Skp family chaperone for outer membrane proteins